MSNTTMKSLNSNVSSCFMFMTKSIIKTMGESYYKLLIKLPSYLQETNLSLVSVFIISTQPAAIHLTVPVDLRSQCSAVEKHAGFVNLFSSFLRTEEKYRRAGVMGVGEEEDA